MYKGASKSMKHRHRAAEVRSTATVFVCPDDFNAQPSEMTLEECLAERATVLQQKAQAENQLQASKQSKRMGRQHAIGMVIQGHCTRLSELNDRIRTLRDTQRMRDCEAFKKAACEVLGDEDHARVCARADEIRAKWGAGDE